MNKFFVKLSLFSVFVLHKNQNMFFCMSAIQLGLKFVSKIVTLFEYPYGMNVRVKALSKRTNGI